MERTRRSSRFSKFEVVGPRLAVNLRSRRGDTAWLVLPVDLGILGQWRWRLVEGPTNHPPPKKGLVLVDLAGYLRNWLTNGLHKMAERKNSQTKVSDRASLLARSRTRPCDSKGSFSDAIARSSLSPPNDQTTKDRGARNKERASKELRRRRLNAKVKRNRDQPQ